MDKPNEQIESLEDLVGLLYNKNGEKLSKIISETDYESLLEELESFEFSSSTDLFEVGEKLGFTPEAFEKIIQDVNRFIEDSGKNRLPIKPSYLEI
jgi:hypothetical protein